MKIWWKLFGLKCSECKKRKPYTEFMEVPVLGDKTLYVCKACYPEFSRHSLHLY